MMEEIDNKETYEKAKYFNYNKNNDIKMKHSNPSYDKKREKYRIEVTLVYPQLDPKEFKPVCHYLKSREKLIINAKTVYAEELYTRIPAGALCAADSIINDVTLATIFGIHNDDICESIRTISADALVIQADLCAHLSDKGIANITTYDCLNAIEIYANTKRFKNKYPDSDKLQAKCKKILKSTFSYCASCGFIQANPMSSITEKRSLKSIINSHMKIGSLTSEQDQALYKIYSADILNPKNMGAALLHLTGLTVGEICGLKFGDIYNINCLTGHEPKNPLGDLDENGDYVLFISRTYKKTGSIIFLVGFEETAESNAVSC